MAAKRIRELRRGGDETAIVIVHTSVFNVHLGGPPRADDIICCSERARARLYFLRGRRRRQRDRRTTTSRNYKKQIKTRIFPTYITTRLTRRTHYRV